MAADGLSPGPRGRPPGRVSPVFSSPPRLRLASCSPPSGTRLLPDVRPPQRPTKDDPQEPSSPRARTPRPRPGHECYGPSSRINPRRYRRRSARPPGPGATSAPATSPSPLRPKPRARFRRRFPRRLLVLQSAVVIVSSSHFVFSALVGTTVWGPLRP